MFATTFSSVQQVNEFAQTVFGYDEAKRGQAQAVLELAKGRNVCAVLPTNYGKSFIYQAFASALAQKQLSYYVVIICPLLALAQDQLRLPDGVKGVIVNSYNKTSPAECRRISSGYYQILFISPEVLVENAATDPRGSWLKTLKRVCLFGIDEAHKVIEW